MLDTPSVDVLAIPIVGYLRDVCIFEVPMQLQSHPGRKRDERECRSSDHHGMDEDQVECGPSKTWASYRELRGLRMMAIRIHFSWGRLSGEGAFLE